MDKISYEVNTLLSDTSTYTKLKKDPMRKYQSDFVAILKTLKEEKLIDQVCITNCMYPTACWHKRATGYRKYTKTIGHSDR